MATLQPWAPPANRPLPAIQAIRTDPGDTVFAPGEVYQAAGVYGGEAWRIWMKVQNQHTILLSVYGPCNQELLNCSVTPAVGDHRTVLQQANDLAASFLHDRWTRMEWNA